MQRQKSHRLFFFFSIIVLVFSVQSVSGQNISDFDIEDTTQIFTSRVVMDATAGAEPEQPAPADSKAKPKNLYNGVRMQDAETVFKEALLLFETADRLPVEIPHLSGADLETIRVQELRKSEFRKTAALYQGLIHRGIESGFIFYNQGNAWYRAGDTARAIVAYRNAERYMPSHPYLLANIQTVTNSENPAYRARFTSLFFWQNRISYPTKFRFAALASILAFFAGIRALFARKKTSTVTAVISVFLAGAMIFSVGIDWLRFSKTKYGVIGVEQTVARKGNDEQYEPAILEPIFKNTEFTLRDQRGNWILIELSTGENGWIPERDAYLY